MAERYRVDEAKVVHEVFETEAVIVNLDTGHYYVLDGSAGEIWTHVAGGATIEETANALAAIYQGTRQKIEETVRDFVQELLQEDLLVPQESGPTSEPSASVQRATQSDALLPFELPTLYKYTEMEHLILMDPIREFDDSGWPTRRTFPAADKK